MGWHQSFVIFCIGSIPIFISLVANVSWVIDLCANVFQPSVSSSTFDYIIVGGGSAGSVLAARLSEDPSVSVLLLEAGGYPSFVTGIPALTAHLQLSPYDWGYETEAQNESCLSMNGQRCKWPRGKMLGGSGGLNYMLYVRGSPEDFDSWESLGNQGWGYKEVLPYFKKSESQTGRYRDDLQFHGSDGPLNVRDSIFVSPLSALYAIMAEKFGFDVHDINGKVQAGYDVPQVTLDPSGWRTDSYRAFISGKPGLRPNLKIMTFAHVEKILFKDDKRTAFGVQVTQHWKTFTINCSREVIVSAGAIGSPQLLMLSGIGPSSHLNQLKIPLILHSEAVGSNLQDHVTTMLGPFFVNQPIVFDVVKFMSLGVAWDFFVNGKGPLTSTAVDGNLFIHKGVSFEFLPFAVTSDIGSWFLKISGMKFNEVWDDFLSEYYGMDAVTILPVLLHPKSTGTIRLRSTNPKDHPIIQPNYFSHPDDLQNLVEGIQLILKMINNTVELKDLEYSLPSKPFPQCQSEFDQEPFGSEYWSCYCRHLTMTMYHPTGTCRMGKDTKTSVVDPDLKVHGLNNVRVIDASIMPEVVSGNTNAAVVMIAEKGSDLIKATWKSGPFSNQPTKEAREEL